MSIGPRSGTWLALALLVLSAWCAVAGAQTAAEAELARTYAPVLRVQDQPEACGPGEAYEPIDVDRILDSPEVALRGPWDRTNIAKIGPTAEDLARGLDGYHLDFPGDVLAPGCVYERWQARMAAEGPPTVYAHVVTEPGRPGKLALQYWFFYVFNDWNNTHESDWEMIQLNFDADTPEQALARGPTEVGYSQHSSAERADWGGDEIEIVDGTHPVVYPGEGSHANYLGPHLYLMRSTAEGVGCDKANGDARELTTALRVIPGDPAEARERYPWLAYRGRWGEKQGKLYEAPTGPSTKTQSGRSAAGARRASPCPPAGRSASPPPTSSASPWAADRSCCAGSRPTPRSPSRCWQASHCCCCGASHAPPGGPATRSRWSAPARWAPSSLRPGACTACGRAPS